MTTFPTKPPEAPKAFEHGSGFNGSQEAQPVIPSVKAPAAQPHKKAPSSGTHPKNNPGSTVYDSRMAGQLIRASTLLRKSVGLEPICIWFGD